MRALLALQDGTVLEGRSLGAAGTVIGEVVFNTGMTGYQEILSDPSYAGQIVTLTYPLIGNYGVTAEDFESSKIQVAGFVVREAAELPSNWRAETGLKQLLRDHQVVGIEGVDTRALTKRLRVSGVMMGAITTEGSREDLLSTIRNAPSYSSIDFVKRVTTPEPYEWRPAVGETRLRVALLDCGVKRNIMRSLAALGCAAIVVPCDTPAEKILALNPDGIALSPGPGDPAQLGYIVETVRRLAGKKPMMGICLGNQLIGCAFGSRTFKLKFGHRGGNHPVKDLNTGRVVITAQNHGYAVDPDRLHDGLEVAQINLNDGTVEGLRHRELPIFSIQYHPEASPGPNDSRLYFDDFVQMMESGR
ncbi:MAG: glutamine-hydrolyzing carbamoyl-phosphate synthase small subunit [Armatimonadetes bacterium]|nr:glutamine-hydrolyzing carbamoyl-phosphate synthase small subunit [Armatimonadota bacterium]